MVLGEIIKELEKHDRAKIVRHGWGRPMSYRGHYEQLAFEPAENVTVGSMLDHAKSALGQTFEGYRGGNYTMDEWTDCWISEYGRTSDALIGERLLQYILGDQR